jgi:hypothetical protein
MVFFNTRDGPGNSRLVFDTPDDQPYQKEGLIAHYENHNREVIEYFRHRPENLLVLNVAEKGSYKEFCDFLGVTSNRTEFPWNNKTADIKPKK